MNLLLWIIGSTFAMSLIALIGLVTLALKEELLKKILLPLVAFSAGALLSGAVLHLLPEAVKAAGCQLNLFIWFLIGFSLFFLLEQFISWHHCHRSPHEHKKPVSYLILIADAVHNFIGGIAIAGSFIASIETGIITWLAAAAHEIPQELGDFGILLHSGWDKYRALTYNFISALTVVLGGLLTFFISKSIDTTAILPFAAGNFVYIASSDLIPEVKHSEDMKKSLEHFAFFLIGVLLLLAVKLIFSS